MNNLQDEPEGSRQSKKCVFVSGGCTANSIKRVRCSREREKERQRERERERKRRCGGRRECVVAAEHNVNLWEEECNEAVEEDQRTGWTGGGGVGGDKGKGREEENQAG